MSITVTINEEQIRAAILSSEPAGKIQSLELELKDSGSLYGTITYHAKGAVSAEESLIPGYIVNLIRRYLRGLGYTLEPEASVTIRRADEGITAKISVERMPDDEGTEESTG
jgi:hypothetical protein